MEFVEIDHLSAKIHQNNRSAFDLLGINDA
jgi:hypothetical protein